MSNIIDSIIITPVPPRYPVLNVGYLTVNAKNKILTIYDDEGNSKIVSAEDSTITSSVVNELIDTKLSGLGALRFKGVVETEADLPTNADIGDVYQVNNYHGRQNCEVAWNGQAWVYLGTIFDATPVYQTIANTSGILMDIKVDKVEGKSLLLDSEITRLSTVDNYNDTELRNIISGKANLQHWHQISSIINLQEVLNNKADIATTLAGYNINDAYTKIQTDNKFLSSYIETDPIYTADKPSIALKSEIPSAVSQLTNDVPYLSSACLAFPDDVIQYAYYDNDIPASGTTETFCQKFCQLGYAKVGMMYLGQVRLNDLPWKGNAECIIQIPDNNIMELQLFSTDIKPHKWTAMYYDGMVDVDSRSVSPWKGMLTCPVTEKSYDPTYTPLSDYDAVTKKYVDSQISGKVTFKLVSQLPTTLEENTLYGIPQE